MKRNNIEAIDSLSPAQQGMFYETIRVSEPGIHIEQSTYVLSGDLQVDAFKQAWQWIMDRHAILRTSFVWKGQAEPLQVVLHEVNIQIDQQDWRGMSSVEQESCLAAYLSADRQQGFKLSQAPLMRLALFQTEEHVWYFVWMYHHILMDGWCHSLILKEFS